VGNSLRWMRGPKVRPGARVPWLLERERICRGCEPLGGGDGGCALVPAGCGRLTRWAGWIANPTSACPTGSWAPDA
jgi:hypothetical protein